MSAPTATERCGRCGLENNQCHCTPEELRTFEAREAEQQARYQAEVPHAPKSKRPARSTDPLLGEEVPTYTVLSADNRYRFSTLRVGNAPIANHTAPDGRTLYSYPNPDYGPPPAEGGVLPLLPLLRQGGILPESTQRVLVPTKVAAWPVLDPAAYYGLAGDITRLIEPHSEADPVAVLLSVLLMFGNVADREYFGAVDGKPHPMNEFAVLVGTTSRGRKGTSLGYPKQLFREVAPEWVANHIIAGLSSGEGLINLVRDPSVAEDKDGKPLMAGVADKRVLIIEEEYARVLKNAGRDGNTLSATLREAWDSGNLRTITRTDPLKASNAHLSIIGHVTSDDLLRYLTENETGNGFANRFLWLMVRRSKVLPDGGGVVDFSPVRQRLKDAIDDARAYPMIGTVPILRDAAAAAVWKPWYYSVQDSTPGLLGAVTARAEAHVLRLSLIYAALDRSRDIQLPHVQAAIALWQYCEASAAYVFGDKLGDPVADKILELLGESGATGADKTDIWNLFGRNVAPGRLQGSLESLLRAGRILEYRERVEGRGGRPRTVYTLNPDTAKRK